MEVGLSVTQVSTANPDRVVNGENCVEAVIDHMRDCKTEVQNLLDW